MNKKGMELSITIVVTLIIAAMLLGLGIMLLKQIFGGAEQITEQLDARTEREIERLIQRENQIVAIPFNTKEAHKGEDVRFGIGIRNTRNDWKSYTIIIQFHNAGTMDGKDYIINCKDAGDQNQCDYINENWVRGAQIRKGVKIDAKDFQTIGRIIKVDSSTGDGTTAIGRYQFVVCVFEETGTDYQPNDCSAEAYNFDKTQFYSEKIYPVTIVVS